MVMNFINFFIDSFMPNMIQFMSTSYIVEGISWFAFLIGFGILCIIVGGILIR